MPDWSYHTFFKPLLFKMSAEKSRDLTLQLMNTVVSLPFGNKVIDFFGHMAIPAELKKTVAGVTFPSPVGISGALDQNLKGSNALSNLGIGFLEIGPVSIQPISLGKKIERNIEKETLWYEHLNGNIGLKETVEKLDRLTVSIPIGIHVKGEKEDLYSLVKELDKHASFFILNEIPEFDEIQKIRQLTNKPLFIQMNVPAVEDMDLTKIEKLDPDGFLIREGISKDNGIELGRAELPFLKQMIKILLPFNKPIMTSGGVHEPNDALDLLNSGASLIQLHSGFVYSGPGLPKRMNERILLETETPIREKTNGWIALFLMGVGVFIAGIIALFIGLTQVLLDYDEQFLGIKREEIISFNHLLFHFMSHDRICLSGVMISAGFIYMQLSFHGIRTGEHWARKAYIIAAVIGFLNLFYFIGFGYFDKLHFIYYAVIFPFFIYGLYCTKNVFSGSKGANLFNSISWKRSQFGQCMFVITGMCLLSAGIVISIIGMNGVFVKEDLAFFSLTPEQVTAFNHKLIPLIAHDRAGFGGALISEGFLLLLISLWGYREGHKWIWWTLFIGGLPGFITGIGTHFMIGYDNHLHLSPAYLLFVFYVLGLVYSYSYLCSPKMKS